MYLNETKLGLFHPCLFPKFKLTNVGLVRTLWLSYIRIGKNPFILLKVLYYFLGWLLLLLKESLFFILFI